MTANDATFGEWWVRPTGIDPSVLEAYAGALRCAPALCRSDERPQMQEVSPTPVEIPPFEQFTVGELTILERKAVETVARARVSLDAMHESVARDWYVPGEGGVPLTGHLLELLADGAPVHIAALLREVEVTTVPDNFPMAVDLAMFPPLPSAVPPQVWLSSSALLAAKYDVAVASRLVLAIVHEVAGHVIQHRGAVVGRLASGSRLDRELMEGWAVYAEGVFRGAGEHERLLVDLYALKRLLPLVASRHSEVWADRFRPALLTEWPNYFSDARTHVYRRAIGAHARGYVRVLRSVKWVEPDWQWASPASTPWI